MWKSAGWSCHADPGSWSLSCAEKGTYQACVASEIGLLLIIDAWRRRHRARKAPLSNRGGEYGCIELEM